MKQSIAMQIAPSGQASRESYDGYADCYPCCKPNLASLGRALWRLLMLLNLGWEFANWPLLQSKLLRSVASPNDGVFIRKRPSEPASTC
eukprot:6899896-Heterocapsa_arctica.AAC.1